MNIKKLESFLNEYLVQISFREDEANPYDIVKGGYKEYYNRKHQNYFSSIHVGEDYIRLNSEVYIFYESISYNCPQNFVINNEDSVRFTDNAMIVIKRKYITCFIKEW